MSAGASRSGWGPVAATLAVLAVLVAGLGTAAPATAADPVTTALAVDLTGQFTDADATRSPERGVSVGVVASTWTSDPGVTAPRYGFTFAAPCATADGATSCAALQGVEPLYWHWDFGDGRTQTTATETPGDPIVYTRPGSYTVTVTVDNARDDQAAPATYYAGTAELRVLVAPRFADADAAAGTKSSPADADAIWATAALGLLGDCGTYLPGRGELIAGAADGDEGRLLFCPDAPALGAPAPPAGDLTFTHNGVFADTDCLSAADACGLPAGAWADTLASGDVHAACAAACRQSLTEDGTLAADGTVRYRAAVCADNWTVRRDTPGLVPGVEAGCASYGDFLAALALALDGGPNPDADLAAGCPTGATPPLVRRAVLLLRATRTALANPGLVRVCDTDAALTKAEAYALVAAAAGTTPGPEAATATLRDLSGDPQLGTGPLSTADLRPVVAGLLDQGAPLVGRLSCPDAYTRRHDGRDPGACFNGGEGLYRRDAAALLAWLAVGPAAHVDRVRATLTPHLVRTDLGAPAALHVTLRAPDWYPADATAQLAWTVPAGYGAVHCPSAAARFGADHRADLDCTFTGALGTSSAGITVAVAVTDDQGGTSAGAAATVVVANDAPDLGALTYDTDRDEGTTLGLRLRYHDPQDDPVTVGVRSCLPERDGGCVSEAATFPRDADRARTVTADGDPAAFVSSAATDVGTVTVTATTGTAIGLRLTPHDADNNGDFDFVVQACDPAGACATRYVHGRVDPVNDAPTPLALITADAGADGRVVTLTGDDPRDAAQPGYPAPTAPLDGYRLCQAPSGWDAYWVTPDGARSPAVAAATSTTARLQLIPQTGTPAGVYTFTYQVRDVGAGTDPDDRLWSGTDCSHGALGQIQVTSSTVGDRDVTVTRTPAAVAAYTEPVTVTVTGTSADARTTIDWGDGTRTGPVSSTTLEHVYTSTVDARYPIRYTVVEDDGTRTGDVGDVDVAANHVSEPTFETGASTGWTPADGSTATVAEGDGRHGTRGLRLDTGTGTGCGIGDDVAGAAARTVAGAQYTAKAWVLTDVDARVRLTLAETFGGTGDSGEVPVAAHTWTRLRVDYTATTNDGSLALQLTSPDAAGAWCLRLDDASVTGQVNPDAASYRTVVLADDPWAYYPLDEPAGSTTAHDYSGHARHATVTGGYSFGTAPVTRGGSTGSFTSTGGFLQAVLGDVAPNPGNEVTVEFWTSKDAAALFGGAGTGTAASWPGGTPAALTGDPGRVGFTTPGGAATADWSGAADGPHLVTAVFVNGDQAADRLYVDAQPVPLSTVGTLDDRGVFDTLDVGGTGAGDDYWPYPIDDLAVFAGGLDPGAIQRHYQAGTAPALAAFWAESPVAAYAPATDRGTPTAGTLVAGPGPVAAPVVGTAALADFAVDTVLPTTGPQHRGQDGAQVGRLWRVHGCTAALVDGALLLTTADGARYRTPLPAVPATGLRTLTVNVGSGAPQVFVDGSAAPVDLLPAAESAPRRRSSRAAALVVPAAGSWRAETPQVTTWPRHIAVTDRLLTAGGRVWVYDAPLSPVSAQAHYTGLVAGRLR